MKKTLIAATVAGIVACPAFAEDAPAASPLTFNVGAVSDYLFRGVSQTHGDPAVSAGVDYAFSNGFYIGAWASTITWVKDYTGKGSTEVDLYGGYRNTFAGGDWGYDLGVIGYTYPNHGSATLFGEEPNTTEVYAALSYKTLSVKYSYVVSDYFIGWRSASGGKTDGSGYLEANYSHDLGNGWGLTAHVGHQKVKDLNIADYTDWKIGITKDVGFGVVGLAYSDTNAKGECSAFEAYCWPDSNFVSGVGSTSGLKDVAKGKAVLSFSKSF
ncbi:MAG: TorF family putative porin [Rhodocyclaceae bacterium]|nr:TorF family putative porin [Rhodocyclaceae bacterium]